MNKERQLERLSDEELLQVFLPRESVNSLIREYASVYNVLTRASEKQLGTIKGIGAARARKMMVVRELVDRMYAGDRGKITTIHGSTDAIAYFQFLRDRQQEEFWCMMLDAKNQIVGVKCISIGTLSSASVGPREVFHAAVQAMAASIIVCHNHPSGQSTPSREDIRMTEGLQKISAVMGIPVLDHIIVAKYGSRSMLEQQDIRKVR